MNYSAYAATQAKATRKSWNRQYQQATLAKRVFQNGDQTFNLICLKDWIREGLYTVTCGTTRYAKIGPLSRARTICKKQRTGLRSVPR